MTPKVEPIRALALSAITIWQPWASLISEGAKRFEFRAWPAPTRLWGERIAIHAAARPMKLQEVRELLRRLKGPEWRSTGLVRKPAIALLEDILAGRAVIPLSSVVCTVKLGQPVRDKELADRLGTVFVNDSGRSEHSNWGWPLTEIERLVPVVPARGQQGWWFWTPSDALGRVVLHTFE
jgi:hypothetical protein